MLFMMTKRLLAIAFMMLAMISLTSTAIPTQARSLSEGDDFSTKDCPTDNIPDHVAQNIRAHSSNGYAHHVRGIYNPPGC